ncbi:Gfo/Idh/MocA family protein [Neorhizobium petrolearium]|uniref:Gfo/Idh/MocA family oxidoreductase n=1 Tax=Neorhizobium petrolearium TaxID=515361 RepID=A0ABY8M0H4_9HYPH|nr:Gfo/Idh/MocA family oxidoreductase [Neorhizobium petrolearium]MCC2612967.1 Gfo/Idh/MocA family oxidoreductase [Neorhizobium petrolearium]WGI68070.1 Gfo/Idh/MocA family oxidoreductase [Neorhizobium petrolearium]
MTGLGVGLIGTGYMGKCHALAWNSVASVFGDVERPRLVALAEVNADLAARKAAELGFATSTGNWRDLIDNADVDVISVTTPNAFHAEMAIAALEAGKHVWCEKPMAPLLADAERMQAAAARSGKVAAIGYNYIQNPMIRQIKALIDGGSIGTVNHVRIEMDEDFMADPQSLFYWKSEASSGYGALDDFAVHPLSLLFILFGHVETVIADMVKPYAERPLASGGSRAVENHDIASVLLRLECGISSVLMANRSAWGRKGRIALQIFGSTGSILFDQERMNEIELYQNAGEKAEQGFRRILAAPIHAPYDRFIPAPGHGLGFNDLKIIECRELLSAIRGERAHLIHFDDGLRIERSIHAMARSFAERRWVSLLES